MRFRHAAATAAAVAALPLVVACGAVDTTTGTSGTTPMTSSSPSSTTSSSDSSTPNGGSTSNGTSQRRGPGSSVDANNVSTEAQLVALVQEAYGEASLGLHRGHQPVEDVLDEVLKISHDELHVRMEQKGQNLAAVAEDLGLDPQTLIDALVARWTGAVQSVLDSGAIDQAQAAAYTTALEEAFTYRVTWDGSAATPSFTGVDA